MNGISADCPPSSPRASRLGRLWASPLTGHVCRYALAAVFLMAAVTKITDLAAFEERLALHSGLPDWLGETVAAVLPWLELVCGACLALGHAVREAALLLTLLLVGLFVYSLTHLQEAGSCGCFLFPTPLPEVWWWPPLRNCLLLGCGVRVAVKDSGAPLSAGPGPV